MLETAKPKYTVCGFLNGRMYSQPGFFSREEARGYADRKTWTRIKVIGQKSTEK